MPECEDAKLAAKIMKIEKHRDAILIKTTDIHLPQRIGEALRHAHNGELDMHYDEEGHFARVNWRRED